MSEIEKMYENADINKIEIKRCSGIKQGMCQHNCNECESFDYKYPPFTAEKQLGLIKLLSERELYINHADGKYFIFTMNIGGSECSKDFDTSLAKYINFIWQDLTEEEQEQIRRILNE